MGIPKFFRWMSERYPVCSQLVEENRIPEFDNLYLDMNGIFHQCSHPNDAAISFKLPEDEVFEKVCVYIEKLFSIIQPKRVFFMAVDGVAPRAKMNQQRSRRFRSVQEHQNKLSELEENSEMGVSEKDLFDSNCITPGTEFMENLSTYLHSFIQEKIELDPTWQNVQVILSGHEVPGEGEHKIMDYIRALKASPEHDPNTRHCLYGLDADLIMLSLVTHEPHFALLREEVKFANKTESKYPSQSNMMKKHFVDSPDDQRYYLMHINLLREYLELEFNSLKPELGNDFNSVNLIDDFILLCIFIGNDFLPHLPHLHIHDAALTDLLMIYKEVLRHERHYINLQGHLHLPTLSVLFEHMIRLEKRALEIHISNEDKKSDCSLSKRDEEENSTPVVTDEDEDEDKIEDEDEEEHEDEEDEKLYQDETEGKGDGDLQTIRQNNVHGKTSQKRSRKGTVKDQIIVPNTITASQRVLVERLRQFILSTSLSIQLSVTYDQGFLRTLCMQLNLTLSESNDGESKVEKPPEQIRSGTIRVYPPSQDAFGNDIGFGDPLQLLEEYLDCQIGNSVINIKPLNPRRSLEQEWRIFKLDYYSKKLEFKGSSLPSDIHNLTCEYLRGIQWVLLYYYEGVASWDWFFPYHYAPFITDLAELDMPQYVNLKFSLDSPFYPFEQLFAVLPEASGGFLPEPIRAIMGHENLKEYFPEQLESDLNGKKNDWEKVIKLPFIGSDKVRDEVGRCLHLLSPEELKRNSFGVAHLYQSCPDTSRSSKGRLVQCHVQEFTIKKPALLKKGLCRGLKLIAGFPSLHYLSIEYTLACHRVNVFGRPSRNESVVIHVNAKREISPVSIAKKWIGKCLYFQWPYLIFGLVVKVGMGDLVYNAKGKASLMQPDEQTEFEKRKRIIDRIYHKERGIILPRIELMIYTRRFIGMKKHADLSTVQEFAERPQWVPWDLVLENSPFTDPRMKEHDPLPLHLEYAINSEVFLLHPQYGAPGRVSKIDVKNMALEGNFLFSMDERLLNFGHQFAYRSYKPISELAYDLEVPVVTLSRLTSNVLVAMKVDDVWNLGLKLKYSNRELMVPGYTRFNEGRWEVSQKGYDLIFDFIEAFPNFVRKIEREPSKGGCYTPFDFYSSMDLAIENLSKVKAWLEALPELPTVSMHHQLMTRDEISQLESALAVQQSHLSSSPTLRYMTHVPLDMVLKLDHARLRLEHQEFCLGDRAIIINVPGKMCSGAYGYVVGILEDGRIQVRLDTSFRGGTDLTGRCASNRGITVLPYQLLNLTHPHFRQRRHSSERYNYRDYDRRFHQHRSSERNPRNSQWYGSGVKNVVPPRTLDEQYILEREAMNGTSSSYQAHPNSNAHGASSSSSPEFLSDVERRLKQCLNISSDPHSEPIHPSRSAHRPHRPHAPGNQRHSRTMNNNMYNSFIQGPGYRQ